MWKLNIKKGFTLIEVLCSITVFFMLFMAALTIQLNTLKLKRCNEKMTNYISIMESIKNNIIYNINYDELLNIKLKNKCYINISNLKSDSIKNKELLSLFSEDSSHKEDYMMMEVEEGKVLKVNLKLYGKFYDKIKVMECEFYKGNYKK